MPLYERTKDVHLPHVEFCGIESEGHSIDSVFISSGLSAVIRHYVKPALCASLTWPFVVSIVFKRSLVYSLSLMWAQLSKPLKVKVPQHKKNHMSY